MNVRMTERLGISQTSIGNTKLLTVRKTRVTRRIFDVFHVVKNGELKLAGE